MRCKKVVLLLDDHVDGLLAAPEAEAIRDHLDGCRDCRETALALKAASASLSTWNDVEAPARKSRHGRPRIARQGDAVTRIPKHEGQHMANVFFVVDDENATTHRP